MWMRSRMVPQLMSGRGDLLRHFRVFFHPKIHQEKSGLDFMLIKNIQEKRSLVGAPSGVKTNGYSLRRRLNTINRYQAGSGSQCRQIAHRFAHGKTKGQHQHHRRR